MSKRSAWLTPDLSQFTESQDARSVCVPGSLFYLVGGALVLLSESWNWEQHGTATPDETSEYFRQVYEDFLVSSGATLGELRAFFLDTLPDGWLEMSGGTFLQEDYPALFDIWPSVLIPPVPGDRAVIPNMAGRSMVGVGTYQGTTFNMGQGLGSVTVTLQEQHLPSHSHGYIEPIANIDLEAPGAPDILAAGVGPIAQTTSIGSNQPHNNLPPVLPVKWGVYAQG